MSAVEQIIRPFLAKTPSKAEIDAAEQAFEDAKRDQPAALIEGLFAALQRPDLEVAGREQAAVLLRKSLEKAKVEATSLWNRLGAGQAAVKEKLLQVLVAEGDKKVRRKIADCVQSLGNQIIEIEGESRPNNIQEWPELMPTLMQVIVDASKESTLRGDCLYVVKELIYSIWKVMITNGVQTMQVLTMCLQDASEVVCGNGLALLIELLENVESQAERTPFLPLVPAVGKVLQKIASSADSKPLVAVLTIMAAQTEVTKFFKDILVADLVPCLCQIARNHQEEDAQKLAMEAVFQFFMSYPKGTVTEQALVQQALEMCTHFMIGHLHDDVDEWQTMDDEQDLDEEDLYKIGRDNIDRLCKAAAEAGKSSDGQQEDRQHLEKVLDILKPALATLFNSGQWKETVTGLTIFQQIVEYVDDQAMVTQLLSAVQAQLRATHPRVRHMAWSCVSQFSEDHSEVLTAEPIVSQLLTEFAQGLDDPVERVCCRCMEAFQHYGESVEREDLEPFVKPMMQKIAPKLKGSLQLRNRSITTVAVIAGQVEDAFAEYYPDLMPYLKGIIGDALHKVEERTLLGKCFECISLLAKAVGRQGFRQDAETIMEAMIKATQVPNLPSNDPVKEYMMAASQRICSVMKEDFLPMVPHILPGILEKFTLAPKDFQAGGIGAGDLDQDGEVTLTMTKTPDGQLKFLFMSTSDLEDLMCALQCVHTFIDELSAAFAPFVAETAKALVPVFEFNIDEEIRDCAFETWGNLCKCAREANQLNVVSELVMEFLRHVTPAFEQEGHLDLEALKTKADGTTCILKKAGPGIFSQEQVVSLVKLPLVTMMKSFERREAAEQAKNAAKAAGKDDKEDGEDGGDGGEEDEENFRIALAEIAGALMKHHPDAFVSCGLESYLELVAKLQSSTYKTDRKLVLFIACDFLDHLGVRAVPHWDKFMPSMLEDVLCPDPQRRQPACYGVALAAQQAAFGPVALTTAKNLQQVVTQSRGRAKKKSEKPAQACADNALTGVVNILQHHAEVLGAEKEALWEVWLQGLPCQEDEEEGQRNHKALLKFVMEERVEVLKQGASNFPKVLSILVDQYKTPMVDEETNTGIQKLVLNLGQAKLEQFAAALSDKQKKKLLRVHREATSAA